MKHPVAPTLEQPWTYAQWSYRLVQAARAWRATKCDRACGSCGEIGHLRECAVFQAELALVLVIDSEQGGS